MVEGYLLGEDIYPSSNLRQEKRMEKTVKYLLQEAYVDGYNNARISIADELENSLEIDDLAEEVREIITSMS